MKNRILSSFLTALKYAIPTGVICFILILILGESVLDVLDNTNCAEEEYSTLVIKINATVSIAYMVSVFLLVFVIDYLKNEYEE